MVEHVSDFKMPEKIVTRLLKDALPEDVTVSKEAKNVACRSASVFILHLSIIASEKAHLSRRRVLDNKDVIAAAAELGLGEYTPQLVRFGAQRKRNATRKVSSIQKSKSKKIPTSKQQERYSNSADVETSSNANISENHDEEMAHVESDEQNQFAGDDLEETGLFMNDNDRSDNE
uniref:DNA polymerase epsilon subunit 3 n=1 Tax=Aceria tosichella TaxID=561515 RepID=A0A6G1SEB8_9ACAR